MMNTAIQSAPSAAAPAAGYRAATVVTAARSALQWRLLASWAGLLLVPAAVSTLPVWQLLSGAFDHSVHASALAASLDLTAIEDLGTANLRAGTRIGNGALLALLFTLLLSPLLSGMVVHAARAQQRPGLGALLLGGTQEYARLLRMLLWAVVPLAIAGGLSGIAFAAADKADQAAILESSADHARMAAMALAALLFVLADASLDAGRAVLASDRRRKSAVVAWWHGLRLLVRRPLALLGSYLGITLAGLAIAAVLAIARLNVPALGVGGFIGAFALTQLAVVAIAWMRCARLFAMLELVRDRRI